jgi:WD40 repeat protein
MNESRAHGRIITVVAIVALSAGACSARTTPTDSGLAAPAAASGAATASAAAVPAAPSVPGVLGGGLLLVLQLDNVSPDKAKAQNAWTYDVGSGQKSPVGSLVSNEVTCCPDEVVLTADRSRAFLYTPRLVGVVDLAKQSVTQVPRKVTEFFGPVSHHGDRIAAVDTVTGTQESIVITTLAGKPIKRLSLPTGAWMTTVAWSPDDTALAVTTQLPVATASVQLASTIVGCCSVDHGITYQHLLVVPVDGSPVRDLADLASAVAGDMASPVSPPPGVKSEPGHVWREYTGFAWSPDGGRIALTETACQPTFVRKAPAECDARITTVDASTGEQHAVTDGKLHVESMTWSPDGGRLAFIGYDINRTASVYIVDRDGGTPVRLTDAEERVGWSPDGTWIVFRRLNPAVPDGFDKVSVWVMPVDGGEPVFVADHAAAGW